MKLIKKDFCECDNIESSIIKHGVEELSIMKKGYTAKQIADYILNMQDILNQLKKLDISHIFRYTCTERGDRWEKHNDIIKQIMSLLK